MNLFQFDSRIEYFFNMTQELNPFSFSRNMTQRMELFFKKWLIELIFVWMWLKEVNLFFLTWFKELNFFFLVWLKDLNFFFWYDSKTWTFFFWYDSKNWNFSEMTQRIEPFSKIRLKELNFFSVWLKELNFFKPLTELNFFVKCDPNNWNFFWIWLK